MEKKKIYLTLLSLAAVIFISIPVYLLYANNVELQAAEKKINELLLQKDETTIISQVDALTQDNSALREKLAAYEQTTDMDNNSAVKCAEQLVRRYFERSYNEYNAEEYFNALKTTVKDSCTEKGFLSFYPEEVESSAPQPSPEAIGGDTCGGLEVFEEKFTDAIWSLTAYSKVQEDDSVNVFIVFVKDSDRDYLGHVVEGTRTHNIFNASMVYSHERGTWLCDEVYLNTATLGADFTLVR